MLLRDHYSAAPAGTERYNNETTLEPFKGKVWITKAKGGKNICVKMNDGSFFMVGYMDKEAQKDIEGSVVKSLHAMGWNPEDWL